MNTKSFNYGLMAIATAIAFTGCANDEPANNPAFGGESVKTQFAISIGSGSKAASRQSSGTVQAGTTDAFRGITGIAIATTGALAADMGETAITSWINLSDIADITSADSKKIYNDVTVPVGTQNLFFYGKAKGTSLGAVDGYTNFSPSGAIGGGVNSISFTNQAIKANLTATDEARDILNALNAILGVTGLENITSNGSNLKELFFTGNAGNSAAVLHRVQSLIDALATDATGVKTAVEGLFTSNDAVKRVFSLAAGKVSFNTGYDNFPAKYGMPDGAALLNTTGAAFAWNTSGGIGTAANSQYVPVANIVYPAELLYYVASPVKVSDTAFELTDWNKTPASWNTDPFAGTGNPWSGASVLPTSKTIALVNNVNYGVAQLQTTVKAGSDNLSAKKSDNTNQTISTSDIKITGVLIGGQANKVGYNFLPTATSEGDMNSAVYDVIAEKTISTTASDVNYTLVFDNYFNGSPGKVNFAIELMYDPTEVAGKHIKGVDGIIYPGQKFYVIGQLDPEKNTGTIKWTDLKSQTPGTYFPAYNQTRVFIQDFVTKSNVTINTLNNAYVGIPDLRSSLLSFGLSVDLSWKSGLVFDVVID